MFLNRKNDKTIKSFLLFSTLIACSVSVYADTVSHPWKVESTPYLWAMNMDGRVGVGSQNAHVKESFSDILEHFRGGIMLFVDAKKDKFGLFVNTTYAVLSAHEDVGPFTVEATNKFGIFSAGASYEVFKKTYTNASHIEIEPYLGARYTLNDTRIKIKDTGIAVTDNQNWTDPIIGARVRYTANKAWSALIAGDVGGTNFKNHTSYNIMGLIGYKPQTRMKNALFYLGYRLLHQNYVNGANANRFVWDMKLFGPVAGVTIALN